MTAGSVGPRPRRVIAHRTGALLLSCLLGLLATACSSLSSGSEQGKVPGQNEGRVQTGIAVPRSDAARVAAIETDLGVTFDVVRVFRRWDDAVPDPVLDALIASGHRIHVSVRPRTGDGRVIPWRELASAEPDTPVWDEFSAWIDAFAQLPPGTYVTLNHEPETRDSASNGDAADYVAAWRRFAELLRERDADDLVLTWTMTNGGLRDAVRAESWYPGDDVVDVIGADTYNWWTCQGTDRPWVDLSDLVEPVLAFARAKGKPLAIPELASADDPVDPSRRARWLSDAADYLSRDDVAADIEFVAWFDVTAPGGVYPNCIWDHDITVESRDAFAALITRLD